jgi:pSer/pThr/pTyr-binding forkhead associated (FHA) protein
LTRHPATPIDSILVLMNFVLRVVSGPEGLGEKLIFGSDRPFVVGREQGSDAIFSGDLLLSSTHFSIVSSSGDIFLTDLASTNGTFVNETRILRAQVYIGDKIRAGRTTFEVAQQVQNILPNVNKAVQTPPAILTISTDHGDERVIYWGDRLTVGRTDMATWVFSHDLKMSSAHFSIESLEKRWEIRDLNSTNGTFINHKKVVSTTLQSGDTIIAGTTRFSISITTPEALIPHSPTKFDGPNEAIQTPKEDIDVSESIRETTDWFATPQIQTVVDESDSKKSEGNTTNDSQTAYPTLPSHGFKAPTHLSPQDAFQGQNSKASIPFRITLHCLTDPTLSADYEHGQEISIGRDPHNDLAFPFDGLVSETHARLRVLGNQVVLQDLQSTNGTLINGARIREEVLPHGGRFTIGKQRFKIGFVGQVVPADPVEANQPAVHINALHEEPSSLAGDRFVKAGPLKRSHVTDRPPIVIDSFLPIADLEIPFESYRCGSGLTLFGGCLPSFDPIDIARRLTLATPGWLMTPKAATEGNTNANDQFEATECELAIEKLSATDPSWMIPWSEQWGTQKTLVVYSRSEPKEIKKAIGSICTSLEFAVNEIPPHDKMFEFLANRLSDTITRIFAPLDAVLIELHSGKQWAYFAPKDMEETLRQLRFRRKHRW